jgi:hypothetical protein
MRVGVRRPFLVAVGRVLPVWVESGPLRHVPEEWGVSVHYTGKPRFECKENDMGTSQGCVFQGSLEANSNAASCATTRRPLHTLLVIPSIFVHHGTLHSARVRLGWKGRSGWEPC